MFFEAVYAEGLSQISYIVGDNGTAAVIDPRRDCRIYVDLANRHGVQITHIFETHRHEDFIIGSLELSRRTNAHILHGSSLSFKYGESVREGDRFEYGALSLRILETPGHTPESISILMASRNGDERPFAVFTGDALFPGDVGRTDLYSMMKEELAGRLYDSIHEKLLPLGDHVILYPAHGYGSFCGLNISERRYSTMGYERLYNPVLQKNRKNFIRHKMGEEHHYAPYFRQMEKLNQQGIALVAKLPEPKPVKAEYFFEHLERNKMIVLDVRAAEAFAGAHIAGSLSIPLDKLSPMAGWFLPYDRDIGIVADKESDVLEARLQLMRMGYDNATAWLVDGMAAWNIRGYPMASIPVVAVGDLRQKIEGKSPPLLLDVRSRLECSEAPVEQARRIWVGDIQQQIASLPRDRGIVSFCNDGKRAIIAASLLKRAKFEDVEVCLGSGKAYKESWHSGMRKKAA